MFDQHKKYNHALYVNIMCSTKELKHWDNNWWMSFNFGPIKLVLPRYLYWNACTRSSIWMLGYRFRLCFYNFYFIGFWNCSDSVVFWNCSGSVVFWNCSDSGVLFCFFILLDLLTCSSLLFVEQLRVWMQTKLISKINHILESNYCGPSIVIRNKSHLYWFL